MNVTPTVEGDVTQIRFQASEVGMPGNAAVSGSPSSAVPGVAFGLDGVSFKATSFEKLLFWIAIVEFLTDTAMAYVAKPNLQLPRGEGDGELQSKNSFDDIGDLRWLAQLLVRSSP